MQSIVVEADSSNFDQPKDQLTGRIPPKLVSGVPANLAFDLFQNGNAITSNTLDKVVLEVKRKNTNLSNGVPDVNDPAILRKEVSSSQLDNGDHQAIFQLNDLETVFCDPSIHLTLYGVAINGDKTTYLAAFFGVKRDGVHGCDNQVVSRLVSQQGAALVNEAGMPYLYYRDASDVLTKLDLTQYARSFENHTHTVSDIMDLPTFPTLGTSSGHVPLIGNDGKLPSSIIPDPETQGPETSIEFANAAARQANTPDKIDLIGTQLDTGVKYISTGTSAGDWQIYDLKTVILGQSFESGTKLFNFAKRGDSYGSYCVLDKGLPLIWGRRYSDGNLPSPITAGQTYNVRKTYFEQAPDFAHPDFNLDQIGSHDDPIVETRFEHVDYGLALSKNGMIYAWHRASSNLSAVAGQNRTSKKRPFAIPVFFDDGAGNNTPIVSFDTATYKAGNEDISISVFVDENNFLWVALDNWHKLKFNANLPNAGTTKPVKISASILGDGVKKARCFYDGVYVLLTNGELWGCGQNSGGQLAQGNTTLQTNFVQVASNVDDFELFGNRANSEASLIILESNGSLKGVGNGADSWMGNSSTAQQQSLVTIDSSVVRAWVAGSSNKSLIYEKADGSFRKVGDNVNGIFGDGTTTSYIVSTNAPQIKSIADSNEGITQVVISNCNSQNPRQCFILCGNGKVFCAGYNANGELGNTGTQRRETFSKVNASLDRGEVFVEIAHAISGNGNPHVILRSNLQRVFTSGEIAYGFSKPQGTGGNRLMFEPVSIS